MKYLWLYAFGFLISISTLTAQWSDIVQITYGVYCYRLTIDKFTQTRIMLLLR